MRKVKYLVAGCLLAAGSTGNAALINFTGQIEYHNDVIYNYFTLDSDSSNVRMWTDSFRSGENFDPITALWNADSGVLIDENDNDATINPDTQTYFDSGLNLGSLSSGNYLFTVATYNNFAAGPNLSDGFEFDGQDPIPLAQWDQPANDVDMGPNWSVWLDNVDRASNPDDPDDSNDPASVPEPGSVFLLSLGLAGIAFRKKLKLS